MFRLLVIVVIFCVAAGTPASNLSAQTKKGSPTNPGGAKIKWNKDQPSLLSFRVSDERPLGNIVLIGLSADEKTIKEFQDSVKQVKLEKELRNTIVSFRDGSSKTLRHAGNWDRYFIQGAGLDDQTKIGTGSARIFDKKMADQIGTVIFYCTDEFQREPDAVTIDFRKITLGMSGPNPRLADQVFQRATRVVIWSLDDNGSCKTNWEITKAATLE